MGLLADHSHYSLVRAHFRVDNCLKILLVFRSLLTLQESFQGGCRSTDLSPKVGSSPRGCTVSPLETGEDVYGNIGEGRRIARGSFVVATKGMFVESTICACSVEKPECRISKPSVACAVQIKRLVTEAQKLLAAEAAEQERIERERAEEQRAKRERQRAERAEREREKQERSERERAERERAEKEKQERRERERQEKARAAREQAALVERKRREKVRQHAHMYHTHCRSMRLSFCWKEDGDDCLPRVLIYQWQLQQLKTGTCAILSVGYLSVGWE